MKTFRKPIELPSDDPIGRCAITVVSADAVVVGWLELAANLAEVRVCRVDVKTGKPGVPLVVARTAANRAAGVPRVTSTADGDVIVAWRDVSKRQVLTSRVRW